MNPDTDWKIVSPGILELPTTKYRIVHGPEGFTVFWGDEREGPPSKTLGFAKSCASRHMKEMLTMGYEV